ncbi:MAG TPA: dNTP triphosphohydrolase [Tenuifilaceae bacterium]|nr:dNTP triphosphohydrolase [Tenuifilaceae bacterium]HPI44270.1 dNTP triphosphohydrolase [Tenuifilaceae bacterium]HPN20828.1 dNTP triphosphohydrolase [Tenuifilaceae bacterium]
MNWIQLLNLDRFGAEITSQTSADSTRTNFQRDYDRIIFSSPFRRLQNKTQVFPLPGVIFVHNRLTHSLEVSSVGRSLGNSVLALIEKELTEQERLIVNQIPTVVSAACLAHDLGNPPFGHSGEEAIRKYFTDNESTYKNLVDEWEWNDLTRFEGNANALRLLTHQFNGRRVGGYRLSNAVLASILKYPYPSTLGKKKYGYFKAEADVFNSIAYATGLIKNPSGEFCRHPLVYLVEAADDICYQIMDIEDAHKLGILSTTKTIELYRAFFDGDSDSKKKSIDATLDEVTDPNEQVAYLRAIVISKLVENCSIIFASNYYKIMDGEPIKPLVDSLTGAQKDAMETIKHLAISKVYNHRKVVEIEIAGFQILSSLLDIFCQAVLNPKTGHSKKVIQLIPEQFKVDGSNYEKILSVLDFVSGMTDVYALETYRLIKGINLPSL